MSFCREMEFLVEKRGMLLLTQLSKRMHEQHRSIYVLLVKGNETLASVLRILGGGGLPQPFFLCPAFRPHSQNKWVIICGAWTNHIAGRRLWR